MLRALIHFWRRSLAVLLGAAIATAVLTGALVVGDSVRGSLRALTLDRLGEIDLALVAPRFLPQDLADRLAAATGVEGTAPVVALRGAARNPSSGALTGSVSVYGVDSRFLGLFPAAGALDLDRRDGQFFPSVAINRALAAELGVEVGEAILVTFESSSDIPAASLLGERDAGETIESVRAVVVDILSDRGVGGFGLEARQTLSRTAYFALPELQESLDREGEINALLMPRVDEPTDADAALARAESELAAIAGLADYGLRVAGAPGDQLALESDEFVLRPAIADAAERAAATTDLATARWLTYLANRIELDGRIAPYSTVAAVDFPIDPSLGRVVDRDSMPIEVLADDEIVLDAWLAEDLAAGLGDTVELEYFEVGPRDELITRRAEFRVAAIAAMADLAIDASLTPDFPGIAEADDIASWDPPFPVELDLIRPRDEEYWDLYRAAPKAFVSSAAGRRLWASRFGDVTTLRLARRDGGVPGREGYSEALVAELTPAETGLRFEAVRQRGLDAAAGASDFSGLFLGFSVFLIVAAALLVALLFSLTVEQRSRELGLRLALGYPLKSVRSQLMKEGAVLAVLGAATGSGLAVVYARAIVRALAGWWEPLLDSPVLTLFVSPATLIGGALGSVALVLVTIRGTLRRLKRSPARALLAGSFARRALSVGRRRSLVVAATTGVGAAALGGFLSFGTEEVNPGLFFLLGALLLSFGFALFSLLSRRGWGVLGGRAKLTTMAARNTAREPGRSLLAVILIGSACFVLVVVAANRRDFRAQAADRDSGTGGFGLVGETGVPLRADLNRAAGRSELGVTQLPGGDALQVSALRLLPGEDASCLNLYQPEKPRVLGVPSEFAARGGFHFRSTSEETDAPWSLLEAELEPGVIPAIGDYASVLWILHSGLGKDFPLETENGEEIRIRFVGLLEKSIFQSEILISEANFVRHFPSRSGYNYLLFEGLPAEGAAELEVALADYGLDVQSTAEKLAAYQAVENTYMSTFQVLGGLGLLLGTLGLAIVLLRNVLERRGELAAMRAFGYRRATLGAMVVVENAVLLGCGLAIGTAAGLLAAAPGLINGTAEVPWASLALTLAGVFAVGMLASLVAARAALATPLLPALKRESTT